MAEKRLVFIRTYYISELFLVYFYAIDKIDMRNYKEQLFSQNKKMTALVPLTRFTVSFHVSSNLGQSFVDTFPLNTFENAILRKHERLLDKVWEACCTKISLIVYILVLRLKALFLITDSMQESSQSGPYRNCLMLKYGDNCQIKIPWMDRCRWQMLASIWTSEDCNIAVDVTICLLNLKSLCYRTH